MSRESRRVKTLYGEVAVTFATLEGRLMNVSPSYDDCRRLAEQCDVSLKEVCEEAKRTAIVSLEGKCLLR